MAEKEYIERGLAKRVLEANMSEIVAGAKPEGISGDAVIEGYLLGKDHAKDFIAAIPAADVVEVRHGEWIYHECVSSHDGAISGYSCSECCIFVDEEMFDSDEFHKDFCGHCGAKMDGKEQTDETDDAKDHSGND